MSICTKEYLLCCLGNFLAWASVPRISDKSKYFTCNGLRWRIRSEDKSQSIPVPAPKIKRVAEAGDERSLMRQEMLRSEKIPSSFSPSLHFPPPPATCILMPLPSMKFLPQLSVQTGTRDGAGRKKSQGHHVCLLAVAYVLRKLSWGNIAFMVLLLGERMLARGSVVFSYIAHVWVCRGACHKDVKGQESFVEIIDTWGQRNIGMSLAGVTTESFCSTKEPVEELRTLLFPL